MPNELLISANEEENIDDNQLPDMGEAFDSFPGFLKAIFNTSYEIVSTLISSPIKALGKTMGSDTLLYRALRADNIDFIRLSIALGADVNRTVDSCISESRTILHFAKSVEAICALLDAGADIEGRGDSNRTILHFLSKYGTPQIIAELIARGADVNTRDCFEQTPLFIVKDPVIAKLLLNAGANPNVHDKFNGNTPLHETHECRCTTCPHSLPNSIAIIKALISAGANVNARNLRGQTPIFNHGPEGARILMQAGADLSNTDNSGQTALHAKISKRVYLNVDHLLQAKSTSVNLQDANGDTPLHEAVKSLGHAQNKKIPLLVKALFNHGADPLIQNKLGQTPMQAHQDGMTKNPGWHFVDRNESDAEVAKLFSEYTKLNKIP